MIVVKVKARDPRLAQTIADTFINSYLQRHAKANRTSGSHHFFVQQSTILQDQLDKANEELRAAKNKIGLLSIDGQRRTSSNKSTRWSPASWKSIARGPPAPPRSRP